MCTACPLNAGRIRGPADSNLELFITGKAPNEDAHHLTPRSAVPVSLLHEEKIGAPISRMPRRRGHEQTLPTLSTGAP